MATLEELAITINKLQGDMTYRKLIDKGFTSAATGRRANHDFVMTTNHRTLRSGPHRGLTRVDGAVLVMFANKDRHYVSTAIVRKGTNLLKVLDSMVQELGTVEAVI